MGKFGNSSDEDNESSDDDDDEEDEKPQKKVSPLPALGKAANNPPPLPQLG